MFRTCDNIIIMAAEFIDLVIALFYSIAKWTSYCGAKCNPKNSILAVIFTVNMKFIIPL